MVQINKVEIQGYIGNVRENKINDSYVYDFSVATNRAFGEFIEVMWHAVKMWSDKQRPDLEKGKPVHVTGYLRQDKYVGSDGINRTIYYIQAKPENVKIVTNS
jgi:single-stranded DNA-binding protein